jgi:hypothetical protein
MTESTDLDQERLRNNLDLRWIRVQEAFNMISIGVMGIRMSYGRSWPDIWDMKRGRYVWESGRQRFLGIEIVAEWPPDPLPANSRAEIAKYETRISRRLALVKQIIDICKSFSANYGQFAVPGWAKALHHLDIHVKAAEST